MDQRYPSCSRGISLNLMGSTEDNLLRMRKNRRKRQRKAADRVDFGSDDKEEVKEAEVSVT